MNADRIRARLVAAALVSLPGLFVFLDHARFPRYSTLVLLGAAAGALVALAGDGRPSGTWIGSGTATAVFVLVVNDPGWAPRVVLVGGLAISLALAALSGALRVRRFAAAAVAVCSGLAPVPMAVAAAWYLDSWLVARSTVPMVFGMVGVSAVAFGVRPLPGTRRPSPGVSFLWPASVLGAWLALTGARGRVVMIPVGVAAVLIGVSVLLPQAWSRLEGACCIARRPADVVLDAVSRVLVRIDAVVAPVFRFLGSVLQRALLALIWALIVLVPAVVQRVLRRDPTWAAHRQHSRWVPRQSVDQRFRSMWIPDPTLASHLRPQMARRNARTALAVLGPVAMIALIVIRPNPFAWSGGTDTPEASAPSQTAWDGSEAWYQDFGPAMTELAEGQIEQQYAGLETPDIESKYLNVERGWRRVWQPPIGRCEPRVVVWMFGGSTMFGELQRDDYTLSSEIAKAAWRDGVALEVRNGGVHADTSWQQQRRLARYLATEAEPPDLVMFYDGFNDYIVQDFAFEAGMGGPGTFMGMNDSNLMLALTEIVHVRRGEQDEWVIPAPGLRIRDADPGPVAEAALFQYRVTDEQTRAILDQAGIPFVHLFQPNASTRVPAAEGDYAAPADQIEGFSLMRAGLPEGVVDLTAALDGPGPAVYIDEVHTNEAANPIIAEVAWKAMAPSVAAIAPEHRQASCS